MLHFNFYVRLQWKNFEMRELLNKQLDVVVVSEIRKIGPNLRFSILFYLYLLHL